MKRYASEKKPLVMILWFYESPRVISLWKVHNLKVLKFGNVKILIIIFFVKKTLLY